MTRVDLLHAALGAAARGWPVFPLRPGRKQPRAELTSWESRATVDTKRIVSWWRAHPHDNVAIATGPAGLVVVDLDLARPGERRPAGHPDAEGGADVLYELARGHGAAAVTTWAVTTPSGGYHLYFDAPKVGGPWRNSAGRIGWHIDTRAWGGYVVAPGSVVDDRRYTVLVNQPVVDLPDWIARTLAPPEPSARLAVRPPLSRPGYALAALRAEVERVVSASPGERNAALNRAAWNLGRHIAAGLLARSVVEDALYDAGVAAGGQTPAGVRATVRSAINARLGRAGGLRPTALEGADQ